MIRHHLKRTLARSERGQSLVEMTLGFVVLLVLASGVLDLGRAYFTFVALEDAAGEGALYAAIDPACPVDVGSDSDGVCDPPNNARDRMENAGGELLDWSADVTVTFDPDPATAPYPLGQNVEVVIEYPFDLLTPVLNDIVPSGVLTLTAHATQNVISE